MPKFVIERNLPPGTKLTSEQLREDALRSLEVLRQLGPDIHWIHSFVTDDKIYCIYYSPDETLIREHATRLGIPADRISAVRRLLDPVNFES